LARLGFLGAVAGAAGVEAWRGTTAFAFAGGLALYVAGLDLLEPVAQTIDRPTLLESYPVETGTVLLGLLIAPAVAMLAVGAVGAATAVCFTGFAPRAVLIAGITLIPASFAGLAGAVVSTVQGAPELFDERDLLLPPEAVGVKIYLMTLLPPLISSTGVMGVAVARATPGLPALGNAVAGVVALVFVAAVCIWVRYGYRGDGRRSLPVGGAPRLRALLRQLMVVVRTRARPS
ncbi:MAG TPA: hypothetical protein VFN61_07670, partial [Acidimicrobiales bacterium]|nr:hypothetical protein [Acidimicrobiales bacterium]